MVLPSRHGYDSESNHESTQNQMLFAGVITWFETNSGEAFWVMSQSGSLPGESTWVMSQFWVDSWKTSWVMSWNDSSLRDTAWVMSWLRNLAESQKMVNEIDLEPKKVNKINSWFESLSHDLIRINIAESFWVMNWFELKFWNVFLKSLVIWIKIFWKLFESWADLNQIQKSIFSRELIWISSCKVIVSHELSRIKTFWDWVESNKKRVVPMSGPETEYVAIVFHNGHVYSASLHCPMSIRVIDPVCPQATLSLRVTLFHSGILCVANTR